MGVLRGARSPRDPARWGHLERALIEAAREAAEHAPHARRICRQLPPVLDEQAALARFAKLSQLEAAPRLRALLAAADARGLSACSTTIRC